MVAPYVTDDEVDLTFEFDLAEQLLRSVNAGDPAPFASQLADVLRSYPPGQFAPFLTNHDQDRVMSQLGGGPEGVAKAKLAASALLTLPGVPFLYYGEEIGMVGVKPDEMIRTPMQWDATEHAGFTTGTPWEPVNDDYTSVNVATQQADPDSLLRHYQRLLTIRREHPALSIGALQALQILLPRRHRRAAHDPRRRRHGPRDAQLQRDRGDRLHGQHPVERAARRHPADHRAAHRQTGLRRDRRTRRRARSRPAAAHPRAHARPRSSTSRAARLNPTPSTASAPREPPRPSP